MAIFLQFFAFLIQIIQIYIWRFFYNFNCKLSSHNLKCDIIKLAVSRQFCIFCFRNSVSLRKHSAIAWTNKKFHQRCIYPVPTSDKKLVFDKSVTLSSTFKKKKLKRYQWLSDFVWFINIPSLLTSSTASGCK